MNDAVFYLQRVGTAARSTGGRSREDEDSTLEQRKREVDEEKYPEFYRKTDRVKGSNQALPKPFGIGIIVQVSAQDREGGSHNRIRVRKMYRPEDTCMTEEEAFAKDINYLLWSNETVSIDPKQLRGK